MRRLALTIPVLLAAGALAALLLWPQRELELALGRIAASDPGERGEGWAWLLAAGSEGEPRAADHLERVTAILGTASDAAVLDAGEALRHVDLWSWSHQPTQLVLRETALRASQRDHAIVLPALATLGDAPRSLPPDEVLAIFGTLLAHPDHDLRHEAMDTALGWIGRDRPALLAELPIADDDHDLQRRRYLAMAWAARPPSATTLATEEPVEVLEAKLLCLARCEPTRANEIIDLAKAWSADPRPAFEYVLMYCDDRLATRELERWARRGNRTAAFALQARSRHRDDASSRRVVGDESQEAFIRQLAAWRWENVDPERVMELLAGPVAAADGSVCAAALLAEKRLPREQAVALAEQWIRSFDDDRKRAGAVLAALLSAHAALLGEAYRLEDMAGVRTIQRLALDVLDPDTDDVSARELAHRARDVSSDAFDADVVLCRLAAGDPGFIAALTTQPSGDIREAVRRRTWLLERFVPWLDEQGGRPIGGDPRALRLHFDALDQLRALTARDLEFDPSTRTFGWRSRP